MEKKKDLPSTIESRTPSSELQQESVEEKDHSQVALLSLPSDTDGQSGQVQETKDSPETCSVNSGIVSNAICASVIVPPVKIVRNVNEGTSTDAPLSSSVAKNHEYSDFSSTMLIQVEPHITLNFDETGSRDDTKINHSGSEERWKLDHSYPRINEKEDFVSNTEIAGRSGTTKRKSTETPSADLLSKSLKTLDFYKIKNATTTSANPDCTEEAEIGRLSSRPSTSASCKNGSFANQTRITPSDQLFSVENLLNHGAEFFKCKRCERGFFILDDIQKHIREHTEEKSNKCPFCDRDFSRYSYLNVHKTICKAKPSASIGVHKDNLEVVPHSSCEENDRSDDSPTGHLYLPSKENAIGPSTLAQTSAKMSYCEDQRSQHSTNETDETILYSRCDCEENAKSDGSSIGLCSCMYLIAVEPSASVQPSAWTFSDENKMILPGTVETNEITQHSAGDSFCKKASKDDRSVGPLRSRNDEYTSEPSTSNLTSLKTFLDTDESNNLMIPCADEDIEYLLSYLS